jgi:membrane-associated phospholipid phosphatase
MRPIRIKPTRADEAIALSIARHTRPAPEALAKVLTWGADEKILLALAAVGWLATRDQSAAARRAGDHALLVTATVALLPHLLKRGVNQTRPDRLTVIGHLHGIPISGRAEDAFPSGHALHMGALASAATPWPKGWREAGLAVAIGPP